MHIFADTQNVYALFMHTLACTNTYSHTIDKTKINI